MKIEFNVAPENIIAFAEELSENEMENQIEGTDNGNLLVSVHYTRNDRDVIQQLEDLSEPDSEDEDNEDDE